MSGSDDEVTLSAGTLAALKEFRQEEAQHLEEFEKLFKKADEGFEEKKRIRGMELFKEDWQLSQFWYTDDTADLLADALLEGADSDTVIAIVSAPSVYAAILKKPKEKVPSEHIYLLEYDKRFDLLAGHEHYIFYDYVHPLEFADHIKGKVDRLLIDPPFLHDKCQTNSSITVKSLLKNQDDSKTKAGYLKHRFISCTGERMAELISTLYPNTKITTFLPQHANGLSNEFRCYADFEWKNWKFVP